MNLSTASRTLQLLGRILDPRTATEPFLPPRAEKRALPLRPAEHPLPRCAPEEQGISSRHIRQFLEELDRDKALYMQDVMVLRRGCVLCEAAFGSQDLRAAKSTFSACKSVTSLAVGLLVDDGVLSLTEKVADIFGDLCTPAVRRRLKDLTVEHLLTMRAGIQFSEAEALTEADWVRRFLNASVRGEPGTDFLYNSLNSYILSAIIALKAGKGVHQLVRERLFAPLGITDTLWETCPAGIDKGGWGFYIRPEDMAKLGQLVLDGGLWQGERLLSQTYLDAALTAHAVPPETTGDFNYGYHIWVGRRENTFLFNGMLGQNVLGFRDSGILLVTNATSAAPSPTAWSRILTPGGSWRRRRAPSPPTAWNPRPSPDRTRPSRPPSSSGASPPQSRKRSPPDSCRWRSRPSTTTTPPGSPPLPSASGGTCRSSSTGSGTRSTASPWVWVCPRSVSWISGEMPITQRSWAASPTTRRSGRCSISAWTFWRPPACAP